MLKQLVKISFVLACLTGSATCKFHINNNYIKGSESNVFERMILGSVTDRELADISQHLHENDVNGAKSIDLDLQSKTYSGNTYDQAPYP